VLTTRQGDLQMEKETPSINRFNIKLPDLIYVTGFISDHEN